MRFTMKTSTSLFLISVIDDLIFELATTFEIHNLLKYSGHGGIKIRY